MDGITKAKALAIGDAIGVDWYNTNIDEFMMGLDVELEHGSHDPETDVTNNDVHLTGKIAWAHLKEFPDYYTRLEKMEKEAKRFWGQQTA